MSAYLKIPVPSLTGLSSSNGGVFPSERVVAAIDGSSDVRTHGSPMPAWGFKLSTLMDTGPTGLKDPEAEAQAWIRSIVRYLESIQE